MKDESRKPMILTPRWFYQSGKENARSDLPDNNEQLTVRIQVFKMIQYSMLMTIPLLWMMYFIIIAPSEEFKDDPGLLHLLGILYGITSIVGIYMYYCFSQGVKGRQDVMKEFEGTQSKMGPVDPYLK